MSEKNERKNIESLIRVAVQGDKDYEYYTQYEWLLHYILPILTKEQLCQFLTKLLIRNKWTIQEKLK